MLCYAMLCYAMLCCAVLCYAVLCYARALCRSLLAVPERTDEIMLSDDMSRIWRRLG